MKVLATPAERDPLLASAAIFAALALLTASVVIERPTGDAAIGLAVLLIAAVYHRTLLSWRVLLSTLVLVILFVPIRRYIIPGGLPFQLEPYRLLVAFIILGWGISLLTDPRVRLRRTGLEGPQLMIVVATLASVIANGERVDSLGADVAKSLTFFASFVLIFFMVASVVRTREAVERLLRLLVLGGAVVAVLAVFEARTQYNPFNDLDRYFPFLAQVREADIVRGSKFRASGPAQHPIALGALLAVLVPFAVYFAYGLKRHLWWIPAGVLAMGAVSTVSRTAVLMLVVISVTFVLLRPETKRLWPLLLPALAAIHFAVPGTLGTLRASFFPEGGLIAEQQKEAGGTTRGGNRLADLGPALDEASETPLFGQGYGTRIINARFGPLGEIQRPNAFILDNQWLAILLETGVVGLVAWFWLFWRFLKRVGGAAKREADASLAWLYASLTAAVAAFAIGMFTFDAFSFIQVTFVLYFLLAFGMLLVASNERIARRA